ncbi:MAG TPA: hypothetical protein VLL97_02635 [Acidobacteriota bacterium]|nr:hypothetical protein [Acidobacteriota bacterium]
MPRYATRWIDYRLPNGQEFSLAVCGYAGKIRHMYIGHDPVRRIFIQNVHIEDDSCGSAAHCLAVDCPLNRAEPEHLLHMLDMNEDEATDPETAHQWGTDSMLHSFLKFTRKMAELLPEEFKDTVPPLQE